MILLQIIQDLSEFSTRLEPVTVILRILEVIAPYYGGIVYKITHEYGLRIVAKIREDI